MARPLAHVMLSLVDRAIKTSWLALQAMGLEHLPSVAAWQLNERMVSSLVEAWFTLALTAKC